MNFFDDPKRLAANTQVDGAGELYLAMCAFCKRTEVDGVMTEQQIERLCEKNWRRKLAALLAAELVVELPATPGVYGIPGWLNHNDSADELAEKRARDAERKRRPRGPKEGAA